MAALSAGSCEILKSIVQSDLQSDLQAMCWECEKLISCNILYYIDIWYIILCCVYILYIHSIYSICFWLSILQLRVRTALGNAKNFSAGVSRCRWKCSTTFGLRSAFTWTLTSARTWHLCATWRWIPWYPSVVPINLIKYTILIHFISSWCLHQILLSVGWITIFDGQIDGLKTRVFRWLNTVLLVKIPIRGWLNPKMLED